MIELKALERAAETLMSLKGQALEKPNERVQED